MELKVVLELAEDGWIVAHCPSLKGCWSQGKSREEALANIREAIELYLEAEPAELQQDEEHEVRSGGWPDRSGRFPEPASFVSETLELTEEQSVTQAFPIPQELLLER